MTPEEITSANVQLLRAYQLVFGSPAGKLVLGDLAPFCRADETCFSPDPRVHAWLEGRREVWLRIQKFMRLTIDEVMSDPTTVALKKDTDK